MPKPTSFILLLVLFHCPVFHPERGAHAGHASAQSATSQGALTPEQWREDLQFAVDSFLARDRSFDAAARKRFQDAIAELKAAAHSKTDAQMTVGLARAVALSGNAHTRLYILRNRSALRRFPVRVWWFTDGLYVVRTTPEYAEMLGAKVLGIAGRAPERLKRDVAPLFAGNDSWSDYMSAYTMTSPEVLHGLGLIGPEGTAVFEFRRRDGRRAERAVRPLPLRRSEQPTEAWWDLAPAHPGVQGPWLSALPADASRLPLYLRNPQRQYWSEHLARERVYYINYNRAGNEPGGEPFQAFAGRVLEGLQSAPVEKVVVDLRFNTGGNLDVAGDFMRRLASLVKARALRLYVITGRATFSAGMFHVAQLRQLADAVIVGEPVGDVLDYWSEGGNVVLPNSKLTLHYADRFHSYSRVPRPEFQQYVHSDLDVKDLGPDVRVKTSFKDYLAGRDAALDAIISRRR